MKNPNCDNDKCLSETGEVRLVPYGGGGNLILCRACWRVEIEWRKERNRELDRAAYEIPAWETLAKYEVEEEEEEEAK